MESEPRIQGRFYRDFSSGIKSIKIHLANFKYNHKDDPDRDDVYIDREQLENKLKSWLVSSGKSGSYLVAGYRGMGKSSLVNHIIDRITRRNNPKVERLYRCSVGFFILALLLLLLDWPLPALLCGAAFVVGAFVVIYNRFRYTNDFRSVIERFPHSAYFPKTKLRKFLSPFDYRERRYNRIKIKVNLGKEVMNERDVLCLITNHIRIRYEAYMRTGQNKPLWMYFRLLVCGISAAVLYHCGVLPLYGELSQRADRGGAGSDSFLYWLWTEMVELSQALVSHPFLRALCTIALFGLCFAMIRYVCGRMLAFFDSSQKCLTQLRNLSERLSSAVSEGDGTLPGLSNSLFYISLFGRRRKESPVANVRDIENELTEIINTLNSGECIEPLRVQFLIVLDELDKVEYRTEKESGRTSSPELVPPDFSTAIDGFSGGMTNSERRRTILQLLANMKLFLTSASAKFIFISGRELYEAFLADLSDREYAISSIFSGVINVNSFLHPEREQSDISSMTEQYVSEILLPRGYLWRKSEINARENRVLKREIPSLRWYAQYLTELAQADPACEELVRREMEIRHIVMFLRCFIVYLSHVSNGSPKKIVLYFEKYVKRREDCLRLADWDDVLECGVPRDYALYFTPQAQHKIGFIFHLAAPIMDVIINNVSNYDDKLLISVSFLLDHLFKFHGRGFSWRNIEQTPELLDVNKTPELRDFITSILEFMQQIHLSSIMVGLFQFKFRKRISEEISYISRISAEAAAMFNFTLNETQAVKEHNVKLLNYYMALGGETGDMRQRQIYDQIIARIHMTIADLYFQEEDYSRAVQEYRSALNYLDRMRASGGRESASSVIVRISCMLKMGLTCEYCKTYETAYIIYCSLVDEMITVREVAESQLGLDIVDTWTDDWRIKQPMVVDFGVRRGDDQSRRWALDIDSERYRLYRSQIVNGMWDDERPDANGSDAGRNDKKGHYVPAEYSLDFDRMVSGFSKNLSPEKSRFITSLSMFEDVRLIYKAILAKLFVLEKMNMSGITQANIEIAEAEFRYLHRTINVKEKFFISADFFNQLGKILYYKNSLSLLPGVVEDGHGTLRETLRVALYWWNIDLYAYLDDFCFKVCRPRRADKDRRDAVEVKRMIVRFFDALMLDDVRKKVDVADTWRWQPWVDALKEIIDSPASVASVASDIVKDKEMLKQYVDYIADRVKRMYRFLLLRVNECSEQRCQVRRKGWNLPCYACRYYNRSLRILMREMFENRRLWSLSELDKMQVQDTTEIYLLCYSFRKYLRYSRVNHLRLLAMNAASLGNTMYSCAVEKGISPEVLELVRDMLRIGKDDRKEQTMKKFVEEGYHKKSLRHGKDSDDKPGKLGKLDRAILYYLAAYRFYNIAHQPKDAADCLFRILRVIDEVVTVVNFDKKSNPARVGKTDSAAGERVPEKVPAISSDCERLSECMEILTGEENVLEVLFTRYVKAVSAQYGYSAISELHDYRWVFHMNPNEDLNLTRLQTYAELEEPIWLIADIRIKMFNVQYYHAKCRASGDLERQESLRQLRRSEIIRTYDHFRPLGHIVGTFYNQIILNYARFRLNKWILKDMFGKDPLVDSRDSHRYNDDFVVQFIECLTDYLKNPLEAQRLDESIFDVRDTPGDKLQLVEFLLEDSIVCLTEIIYILTPYNHISSFTNSFVAEVYAQLWEWSKMYETLVMVYDFRRYRDEVDTERIFRLWERSEIKDISHLKGVMARCSELIAEDADLAARYGSLSSRFFMRVRHKIDDKTFHHVISNYAAEMALRYYVLSESSHSEGNAYRNQINRNYILNDDLDNDTWLFNTTIERFRLHSEYIQHHRRRLVKLYHDSRFYKFRSYVDDSEVERDFAGVFDPIRFDDALHTNSEL